MIANNIRALRIVSLMTVATAPVALADQDWMALIVLTVAAAALWLVSLSARLVKAGHAADRGRRAIAAEVAVSWLVVSVTGSMVTIALAFAGDGDAQALTGFSSAVFETVSGVTTTGLSMTARPESLGATMQWWRSVLQLGGAIGVVVFGLVVAEESGDDNRFFSSQWSSWDEKPPIAAARRILVLLAGIVSVGVLALKVTGSSWWAALNHATTAASTGGFAITSESARSLTSAAQVVLIVIFILPAISFATMWGALSGQGPALWRRTQVRWTLGMTLGGVATALLVSWGDAPVLGVVFDGVSAATTTGFATGELFQRVPELTLITMFAMFVGGSAGSTAGGVKVARLAWIGKSLARWLPTGGEIDTTPYRWDGQDVEPAEAMRRIVGSSSLIALFVATAALSTLLLMVFSGSTFSSASFEAVSALSNTGLSSGLTAADLDGWSKWVLTATMYLGRVEITAFLALLVVSRSSS